MKKEPLLQISVATSLEAEEAVMELLGGIFARAVAVYTNEETRVTVASVYCAQRKEWNAARRAELTAGLQHIRASGLNVGAGTISAQRVAREDWSESWKRHFKPIAIGSRLLIKPSWIKRRPRKNQAVVVLDPGLSFGTGNHPTTAFCLGELVAGRKAGTAQAFLDIGTGSGILAIAAVKLGYAPVRAFDFDPEAVRVARENARRNGVLTKMSLGRGDIMRLPVQSVRKYQLICANLISNLLIAERKRIVGRLRKEGTLVLAGILQGEFGVVQRAFEGSGLRLVRSRIEGEWQSGAFVFKDTGI
ncbi:MAG: Ribosomal protein methyltransferase [Pedosphaera sp.]|nr:Ribosomal protein methyltransferase [Pedosphaera sp.]